MPGPVSDFDVSDGQPGFAAGIRGQPVSRPHLRSELAIVVGQGRTVGQPVAASEERRCQKGTRFARPGDDNACGLSADHTRSAQIGRSVRRVRQAALNVQHGNGARGIQGQKCDSSCVLQIVQAMSSATPAGLRPAALRRS